MQCFYFALHRQEILFSIAAILSYLATGIACAVYASAWGGPPDACPNPGYVGAKDICDIIPLTATNALQAVSVALNCLLIRGSYIYVMTHGL